MLQHRFLRVATAALMAFALAASPAMASPSGSFVKNIFLVFLPGINENGTLNYPGPGGGPDDDNDFTNDGDWVTDTVCVNTYSGHFYFCICGCVENESGRCQCYPHEDFFLLDLTGSSYYPDYAEVEIISSYYKVYWPCNCKSFVRYCGCAIDLDFV